ncbi:NAD-dependent epimerase/dehydratase family protein [bacterium]|nr:MAG: NAD-dependent epimerase/dehydratase family protein [bacterium]
MVLVTGGAGFIGSHVCEALLAQEERVRVLDNLASGKRSNLEGLDVELIEGDIRSESDLDGALVGVDAVVHLAAEPSVAKSVEDPVSTHEINYTGTLKVLEAMRRANVSRIVYASSAAIYTPNSEEPHTEVSAPDPTSPYGMDKLAGEFALRAYGRLHGFKPTSLRFFNIYGERQDPASPYSGVISIFARRIADEAPLRVFGDGMQSRDFVYVKDLAALIARLVRDEEAPGLMNVGKGQSATLMDLVAALEKATGKKASVEHAAPRAGDIRVSRAGVDRLQAYGATVWTPLEDGLARLVAAGG